MSSTFSAATVHLAAAITPDCDSRHHPSSVPEDSLSFIWGLHEDPKEMSGRLRPDSFIDSPQNLLLSWSWSPCCVGQEMPWDHQRPHGCPQPSVFAQSSHP